MSCAAGPAVRKAEAVRSLRSLRRPVGLRGADPGHRHDDGRVRRDDGDGVDRPDRPRRGLAGPRDGARANLRGDRHARVRRRGCVGCLRRGRMACPFCQRDPSASQGSRRTSGVLPLCVRRRGAGRVREAQDEAPRAATRAARADPRRVAVPAGRNRGVPPRRAAGGCPDPRDAGRRPGLTSEPPTGGWIPAAGY